MFRDNITQASVEVNMFRGEKSKKVLEAIYVLGDDATPREIAMYTGINHNTVRTVLRRLKNKARGKAKRKVHFMDEIRIITARPGEVVEIEIGQSKIFILVKGD